MGVWVSRDVSTPHMVSASSRRMTTKDSYEPATGAAGRFRIEPTEQEQTTSSAPLTKERLLHDPPPGGWATRAQLRSAIFVYIEGFVRHEALLDRAGCKTPPPGCRSSLVKQRAV